MHISFGFDWRVCLPLHIFVTAEKSKIFRWSQSVSASTGRVRYLVVVSVYVSLTVIIM